MLSHSQKLIVRNLLRNFGIELRPTSLYSRYDLRIEKLLGIHKPDILLDVGANLGQFAKSIFELGYGGHIYSFEAIPHVHKKLIEISSHKKAQWTVAPNCAVGDRNGAIPFHITENLASSSMLELTDYSLKRSSALKQTDEVLIDLRTLDDLAIELGLPPGKNDIFLKMDVQGAEDRVLAGATRIIERSSVILCEILLAPFYDDQANWREIDRLLTARGFSLWDIETVMRNEVSGKLEAADLIYIRNET